MKINLKNLATFLKTSIRKQFILFRPGAYSEYLEYILKKQPKTTTEIKSLYYRIFNMTTDDSSKNQLSGLLDFIFNPAR